MPSQNLTGMLNVTKIAENLKTEMRHSWLSNGRQESVAEHSWRLSLMVYLFAPHLDQPVDVLKCLKLAIVHDLGEAKAGDISVFDAQTNEAKRKKYEAEKQCMEEICAELPEKEAKELFQLWLEYEENKSYESKFVRALDKIEVHLQHVEAPLSTWDDIEFIMWFQSKWLFDYCEFDSTLLEFAKLIQKSAFVKLENEGYDLNELQQKAAA